VGADGGRVAAMAEREERMLTAIATAIRRRARAALRAVHRRLLAWTRPAVGLIIGSTVGDLTRTKTELVAENAFLRQQLVVLARQVKRPLPPLPTCPGAKLHP
jgi:hypothetical protein